MTLDALVARTRERLAARARRGVGPGPPGPAPGAGALREPVAWRPDGEEIEKVIEVPFAALLEPANVRVEHWTRDGVVRPVYFYDYGGEVIWGATARIVKHYLDIVTAAP